MCKDSSKAASALPFLEGGCTESPPPCPLQGIGDANLVLHFTALWELTSFPRAPPLYPSLPVRQEIAVCLIVFVPQPLTGTMADCWNEQLTILCY